MNLFRIKNCFLCTKNIMNRNLLDRKTRERFILDKLEDNELFRNVTLTTCTTQAYLSNVEFHEEQLQAIIKHDYPIARTYSNYGETCVPGYKPYIRPKSSRRGRKKREKGKTDRKIQGNGKHFNSQITFELVIDFIEEKNGKFKKASKQVIDSIVNNNRERKLLKYKLFRNGKVQLPGVKQENIELVIWGLKMIAKCVNDALKPKPRASLQFIKADMKNYKFEYTGITKKNQILNLTSLRHKIMEMNWVSKTGIYRSSIPSNSNSRRLNVKFKTPNDKSKKDKIRVIIFPSGKVNLLGAYDFDQTQEVYDYLTWLFSSGDIVTEVIM